MAVGCSISPTKLKLASRSKCSSKCNVLNLVISTQVDPENMLIIVAWSILLISVLELCMSISAWSRKYSRESVLLHRIRSQR